MSTNALRPQPAGASIPGPRTRDQRPCTLPRCSGTATHTYTITGTRWFRCAACGLEAPEVSAWAGA
jgi:hypothetical protein